MRYIFIIFLLVVNLALSQNKKVLDSLNSISNNQDKLDYLTTVIPIELYSSTENVMYYAKTFDSLAKINGTAKSKANALNFLGMANYVANDYEPAIKYYLEAIKVLEKQEPAKKLSRVYNNLAACYNIRKDFSNTEKYFLMSLDIAKAIEDEAGIANTNNNLSILYMQNKMYAKAEASIDIALNYFKHENDSVMMGIAYMNFGNAKLFGENFDAAITNYEEAMKFVKMSQIPIVHAVAQTGIGIGFTKTQNYSKALPYLKEGAEIAKLIKHDEQLMESYNALADYYSLTKNHKAAYDLLKDSQRLKDSIISKEQDQSMANALTKYESAKKDTEVELLKAENKNKEQQRQLSLILALSGLLVASLFAFFAYRNRKQKRILAKQRNELETSVEQKNVLFKEIHHRVKNSLQMVSSLLFLQSENVGDLEAKNAIKDAQNRVRSLGLIHQKLYNKKHLIGVETKGYITELTQDIFNSHQLESQNLSYGLDIENMVLSVDTLTPIGLILNELIVNVLKHAFKEDHPDNKLDIKFYKEDNALVLGVSDNGVGYTGNTRENSFGLKLINALSKKLEATFIIEAKDPKGTEALLHITDFELIASE